MKTSNISVNTPKVEKTEDGEEIMKPPQKWDIRLLNIIKETRNAKKWTQKDLAKKISMNENVIKDIESNKIPYNKKFRKKFKI